MSVATIKLSETTKFIVDNRGKTVPTSDTGIPLIATNCIDSRNLYPVYEKLRYVSQDTYNNWFRSHPKPMDIILTLKGSQNGAVNLVPDPVDFCIAQDMVALRVDETKIDNLYLFAALRSEDIQDQIKTLDVSGVIPHFKKSDFDKLEIPLPPRPLQKFIGKTYFDLCNKIDLLHRQNKTLEAMAETLFRQWFIEEAKEDWELESLGHHIQTINGVSYKSSELNPSNIALVTLKNFGRNGGLRTDGFKEFTGTFKDSQIMEDGDIAVAHTDLTQDASLIGNPIYILNLSNYDKLVISMDLVKVNLDSNTITKCFLFHLLKSTDFKDYALACSNGSSVIHLSKKALPSFKFKCPPTEKIGRFTNLVDPMDQKIQKNIKQIQTLENLRDTLLPKLMSGEVRVQYQTEEVA